MLYPYCPIRTENHDNRQHYDFQPVHPEADRHRRRYDCVDAQATAAKFPSRGDSGILFGLFGLRRLSTLLLPEAASGPGAYSISNLHFLPDEVVQMKTMGQSDTRYIFIVDSEVYPGVVTIQGLAGTLAGFD